MPTRVVLTYREYAALPADGRRYMDRGSLPPFPELTIDPATLWR